MAFPHDGKKFKKGETGNPKGRPPKLLSGLLKTLKEEGYEQITVGQVKDAYEYLISLPKHKLDDLKNDDDQPMFVVILAESILDDRGFEVMEKMLDRAHGKATQKTEVTGEGGKELNLGVKIDYNKLELDELEQLARIANKLKGDSKGDGEEVV